MERTKNHKKVYSNSQSIIGRQFKLQVLTFIIIIDKMFCNILYSGSEKDFRQLN